eukprot:9467408-Pyramimonas_sp.AAC.1
MHQAHCSQGPTKQLPRHTRVRDTPGPTHRLGVAWEMLELHVRNEGQQLELCGARVQPAARIAVQSAL